MSAETQHIASLRRTAFARKLAKRGAPNDCTILRPTTTNVSGVVTRSYAEQAETVCTFRVASHDKGPTEDADRPRGDYELGLPHDTDVQLDDVIVLSSRWYRVVWCPPLTALDTARVVEAIEIPVEE